MTQGKAIVAGVLVLVALVAGFLVRGIVSAPADTTVSGVQETRDWYPNGVSSGPTPYAVAENWAVRDIGASADQAVLLTNSTSQDMYVDYAELELKANADGTRTASSTVNVRLFATSTTEVPNSHDYTAIAADKYQLVVGTWATSTTATTTNSVGTTAQGGQGSIRLPAGWSLIAYINRATNGVCTTGACETATSTNRGYDLRARAHYHFDDTAVR